MDLVNVAEFAPKFEILKQFARELRNVLIPIGDGAIFTGKFRDNDIMYNGLVVASSGGMRMGNTSTSASRTGRLRTAWSTAVLQSRTPQTAPIQTDS